MLKTKFISCALIIIGLQSSAAFASDVVLYSSNDVQTVSTLVDQFEKQNPEINVSVVRAGTGALMQRIKAEAANPLGDIFWSGGLSTIGAFQDQLEPYKSPEASAVPSQYRAAHDQWLGTNTHVTVLMVNTRQAPGAKLPAGWADLADAKWKGRIVIPDPLFSSASYVALYGLRKTLGEAVYSQIVRNAVALEPV